MIFLLLLGALLTSTDEAVYVSFPASSVNTDAEVAAFCHLAVDPVSGTVFIGARNRLHQLDADLRPVRTVMTGPRLDNRLCTESFGAARCGAGGSTVYDAVLTDNINKVFVVAKHVKSISVYTVINLFTFVIKGATGYTSKRSLNGCV